MEQYPNPSVPSGTAANDVNIGFYDADTILLLKNIRPDLVAQYNDALVIKNGLVDDMIALGAEEVTQTTENYHYEEGSYYTTAAVVSLASATAASVVVTINAVGSAGSYTSFGKVGDMVSIGNSKYFAQITNKTGDANTATATLTLSRGTATDFALNDTSVITTSTVLSAPFTVQGHGQAFPDGINLTQIRYLTNIGLQMTATPQMDGSLANQQVNIGFGPNGERYMTTRQFLALTVRAEYERAFAMLFGTGESYTYTDVWGNSRSAVSPAGLYKTADQFAQKFTVPAGLMDIDDLYQFAYTALTSQAGNEFMGYFGLKKKEEWDRIIGTYFGNNLVLLPDSYSAFSTRNQPGEGNVSLSPDQAKQNAVTLGYSSINIQGCVFHAKTPGELRANTMVKGDQAAWVNNSMLFIPATKGVSNFDGNQGKGLSFGMKVRMQNNPLTGTESKMMVVDRGPANLGTNAFDRQIIQEHGLTTYNPSKMILVTA